MEVIYTGLVRRLEQIVTATLQEDADDRPSILSGAHNHIAPAMDRCSQAPRCPGW
jgi:methylmalonyl-CoA mutase cobalamin-binding subunit